MISRTVQLLLMVSMISCYPQTRAPGIHTISSSKDIDGKTIRPESLAMIDMENLKRLLHALQVQDDPMKNKVKRQENKEDITNATPTSTPSNPDEQATPNIKDLEDSFGGNSESATEAAEPETTTARRKTGFYFLVDWNSFLDIDDQKGKRVNLRFQPTIGDPKRFYSVSVP